MLSMRDSEIKVPIQPAQQNLILETIRNHNCSPIKKEETNY